MKANQAIRFNVNLISGNSGVYFGNQNISVGVSSHSKSNNGVGSIGSGTRFHHNTSIVYDPDFIDTPIDDRDVHIFAPHYDHSAPDILNTRVDSINCETVTQNAGVFIGETRITGLDSHEKHNLSAGHIYGNMNQSDRNVNIVYDPDTIDAPIDDRDIKSGVFMSPDNPTQIVGR